MGVVSPNGVGVAAFAQSCEAGRSGISRISFEAHPKLKTNAVAQVREFDPATVMDPVELRRVPRMIPMALAASLEALQSARLHIEQEDIDTQRKIGVALGTGGGGLAFVEDQYRTFFTEGTGSLFSITFWSRALERITG